MSEYDDDEFDDNPVKDNYVAKDTGANKKRGDLSRAKPNAMTKTTSTNASSGKP